MLIGGKVVNQSEKIRKKNKEIRGLKKENSEMKKTIDLMKKDYINLSNQASAYRFLLGHELSRAIQKENEEKYEEEDIEPIAISDEQFKRITENKDKKDGILIWQKEFLKKILCFA